MISPHDERCDIGLRPMTQADIPLGLRLTTVAGWNQTEADWQMLLAAGFGLVATRGTADVGTATIVPYGTAFSWIGMVLVDPAYRRRGVRTALLERAIADAKPYGCVRLDATPQGEPLYARMGFRAEYGLLRMVRRSRDLPAPADAVMPAGSVCRALGLVGLPDLVAFDSPIFGAARDTILGALARAIPYAFVSPQGDALRGYCLGRSGAAYEQIGPVVAEHVEIAEALLCRALVVCGDRPVVVDAFAAKPGWVGFLQSLGFAAQRPYTRMILGCDCPTGMPERQYAIAGAEIG